MNPIIIIGGGVAGLSTAWHLALKGQKVVILEAGSVGEEASRAAAGMLTPSLEVLFGEERLLHLFLQALTYYRTFAPKLQEHAGQFLDFQTSGALLIAIDHDDEAELLRVYDYQKQLELPVELLTPAQIIQREPLVTNRLSAGIEVKNECFIDNLLLIQAFKKSLFKMGVVIQEKTPVEEVVYAGDRVVGVVAAGKEIRATSVVVATGIGQTIRGLEELKINLRPVKGQALELKSHDRTRRLSRVVRSIHRYPAYIVPRADGRLTVGATCEEMGTDPRLTAGAMMDLLYGTLKLIPSMEEMEFIAGWTGYRAAARDNAPIIGDTRIPGLYTALGLYRHGILLSPWVGHELANLIVDGKRAECFDVFGCARLMRKKTFSE